MGFDLTGLGSVADFAKSLVDRFLPPQASAAEKLAAQTELERMVSTRENTLVEAKTAVMVAEMQQNDKYTKRVRPTILYVGLASIVMLHVVLPCIAWLAVLLGTQLPEMPQITLPNQFWGVWGGCAAIYIVGRSAEKRGVQNDTLGRIVGMITGNG